MKPLRLLLVTLLAMAAAPSFVQAAGAHGDHGAATATVGTPAPRGKGRTVTVEMTDNLFNPKTLTVKSGETVRFVLVNKGTLLHEFNINTAAAHAAHRPMMAEMLDHGMITSEKVVNLTMTMPDGSRMSHTDPNSVLVEPGRTAELSWTFGAPGSLEIACNMPGHAESGMVIPVQVTR